MTRATALVPTPSEADRAVARQIVEDGLRRYFAACRDRIRPFVDQNFSLRGSISLHRAAVGWDIARAPLNLTMAAPQVGLLLAARAANRLGATRAAARLRGKQLVVHTAVGKELAWRLHTDLLQLPYTSDGRVAARDALAETILADPRVMSALTPSLEAIGTRGDDPALRRHLDAAMTEYARTRSASTEITTAIISLTTGALVLRRLTPGALSFSPALATAVARRATALSLPMAFPLGGALGTLWYALFPVAPAAVLVMGLTGGLLAATTAASAFAGVLADPVQRRLGLHERRLRRLVDALEQQMLDPAAPAFTVRDHYVARVLDLFDVAGALAQIAAY